MDTSKLLNLVKMFEELVGKYASISDRKSGREIYRELRKTTVEIRKALHEFRAALRSDFKSKPYKSSNV
jgi:hypothetical protein